MYKKILGLVLFVGMFSIAAPAFAATACDGGVGTSTLADVTQHIVADPDSGNAGNWALDTFSRRIQVWESTSTPGTYCAQTTDNGTFTTISGANSPESGSPLAGVVSGTFTGGITYVITGTPTTSPTLSDNSWDSSQAYSDWINQFFASGATHTLPVWSWTFVSSLGESWTNANTGDSGDIHAIVDTTTHVGYATLQAAVDAVPGGDTIELGGDITIASEVTIDKSLTIDGNGHTLFAPFAKTDTSNNAAIGILHSGVTIKNLVEDGTGSTGSRHGINVFEATSSVDIDGVTVENNAASGITVNGSTVTVNNITTKNNTWGGINADQEADAPDPTVVTITGTSVHSETGPDIWRDDNSKAVTVNVGSQYSSEPYTHDTNIVGTIWGLNSATVSTEAELRAALLNPFVETIMFGSDITTTAELDIKRAVTLDGVGHTLKASFNNASVLQIEADNVTIKNLTEDAAGTTGNRGINIFEATGVTLDTVTVENNAKNGVVVNGSTVTANNITTSGNGWEAIDVDLGSNVTTPAALTVTGTSVHLNSTKAAIIIDDITKAVSVTDTNHQYTATTTGNVRSYFPNTKNEAVSSNTQLSSAGGSVAVTANVPAGTIVSGNTSWDGTISAPTATTTTLDISGFNTTVTSAVAIGSSNSDLTFDKGVRLVFAGQAGKKAGWYNHAGTFTEITDTCSADSQSAGDALAAGGSCKIDVGSDLVVWTKHFSTFVTYTQSAVSTGGSSGGSSGGSGSNGAPVGSFGTVSAIIPTVPASSPTQTPATTNTTDTGEVLGAAAFQFGTNLTVGSRGQDVVELQNVLIAEGDLAAGLNTGYFGPLTKAAVIKYQTAHNVSPHSGYVGPLTRAQLNQGSAQTTAETTTATQTLTDSQIASVLNLLASFGADQATIANVSHALGK